MIAALLRRFDLCLALSAAYAARYRDLGAERIEFLDGSRSSRDARFAGVGFTRYGNSHSRLPAQP
jgi:hypothetical protein